MENRRTDFFFYGKNKNFSNISNFDIFAVQRAGNEERRKVGHREIIFLLSSSRGLFLFSPLKKKCFITRRWQSRKDLP